MGPRAVPFLALQHRTERSPLAAAIAVVLHLLIVVLLVAPWAYFDSTVRAGLMSALMGGGGGGGRGGEAQAAAYISVPAPRAPPPPVRTPVPTPVTPPPVPQTPVAADAVPAPDTVVTPPTGVAAPGQGRSDGPGKGSGSGGGEGTGSGTGSGGATGPGKGGNGGAGMPPIQRQMIMPPNSGIPKELKGKTVVVTFVVSASGEVLRVSERPIIDDRSFRRRLEDIMRAYRFRPARDSLGVPVMGTTDATVTFGQ